MKKKFLSLIVAVAMLFSVVTFVVQADTDGAGDYFYFDIEHFAVDIVCTASKKSPFSKASQNELAKQLFQLGFFNPETAVQALGCLAMMDFEGKEEIERVIRDNAGMNEVKI